MRLALISLLMIPLTFGCAGADGKDGETGPAGADGTTGPAGEDGAPGANGEDGAPGADGEDGAPGADGEDGAPGADGEDGAPGADGEDGAPGADGATGAEGAPGADGEDGAPGADGEDGTPGVDGTDAICADVEMLTFVDDGVTWTDVPSVETPTEFTAHLNDTGFDVELAFMGLDTFEYSGGTEFSATFSEAGGHSFVVLATDGCTMTMLTVALDVEDLFEEIIIGWTDYLGEDSSHGANYLLGSPITVADVVNVRQLGLLATSSGVGVGVRMALYTSGSDGLPESLVTGTEPQVTVSGSQSWDVVPSTEDIAPGTYWLMTLFESTGSIGKGSISGSVAYRSLDFSEPFPETFGPSSTYTGQMFNIWMIAAE